MDRSITGVSTPSWFETSNSTVLATFAVRNTVARPSRGRTQRLRVDFTSLRLFRCAVAERVSALRPTALVGGARADARVQVIRTMLRALPAWPRQSRREELKIALRVHSTLYVYVRANPGVTGNRLRSPRGLWMSYAQPVRYGPPVPYRGGEGGPPPAAKRNVPKNRRTHSAPKILLRLPDLDQGNPLS